MSEARNHMRTPRLSFRTKMAFLLAITALAGLLRFYRIGTLPPGDGYDPAYYGVDALQILRGDLPIFLPSNIGREVMFSYLVALCVWIFGIGPAAIHIASALVGWLTVPAVFFVAEEFFVEEEGLPATFGGLGAASMLAASYWHLNWSRYGVRAILVPLFCALTMAFLLRGLRTRSRGQLVAAGLFLGLSFYTYQSARTLPLLVVLAFALDALRHRERAWLRVQQLLLVTFIALVVFAPLGVYFLTHAGSSSERIDQTLALDLEKDLETNWRRLRNEVVDAFRVFHLEGDDEPLFSVPGRPAMNPFLSVLFFIGFAVSLLQLRRPHHLLILSWLALQSVTVFLTLGGQPTKRALGALPAVAMLVALGAFKPLDGLRHWAQRRERSPWGGTAVGWAVLLALGFLCSGFLTYRDYFLVWGANPNLFTHFEAGRAAIGRYARGLPPEETIYISPELPDHPSIVYNSGGWPDLRGYNGRVCFVAPQRTEESTTYIIVPEGDQRSLDLLAATFPRGGIAAEGPLHYGKPYFRAYRIPAGVSARMAPSRPAEANWEDKILLLGHDRDATIYRAGQTIHLSLYYQALQEMSANYVVFTHLSGPYNEATDGPLWAQDDSEPCRTFYPTSVWRSGEIVRDQFELTIPQDAPPGEYRLQMGFYTWPDMVHLTTSGEMTFVLDALEIGPVP